MITSPDPLSVLLGNAELKSLHDEINLSFLVVQLLRTIFILLTTVRQQTRSRGVL